MELSDVPSSAEKPDTAKLHKDLDKMEELLETKHGQDQSDFQRKIDQNTEHRRILAENAVLKNDLHDMKEQLKLLMQAAGGLTTHKTKQIPDQTPDYKPNYKPDFKPDQTPDYKPDYKPDQTTNQTNKPQSAPLKTRIPAMNITMMESVLPDSPDELFLLLEALNPLSEVDPQQNIKTESRYTPDFHALSLYFQENDKVSAFSIDFDTVGGTALHSRINRFISALSHFNAPTLFTRTIIALRMLIMNDDAATRLTTQEVLDAYIQTEHRNLGDLIKQCQTKGRPTRFKTRARHIKDTPGAQRLHHSNEDFEHCMSDLLSMVVLCLSHTRSATHTLADAKAKYMATPTGEGYMDTYSTLQENYEEWCRAAGSMCRTPADLIEDLLTTLNNPKVTKRYYEHMLKPTTRDDQGIRLTMTTIPFEDAEVIIRNIALSLEQLDKLIDSKKGARKIVSAGKVKESTFALQNSTTPAPKSYLLKCEVCRKNHHTKDCARWLGQVGVCINWYLNHLGVRETGCNRDDCPRAHKLPDFAPTEETVNAAKLYSDAKDAADAKKTEHTAAKVAVVQGTVPSDDESSDETDPHPGDLKARRLKATAAVRSRICMPVKVCTRPHPDCTKYESA